VKCVNTIALLSLVDMLPPPSLSPSLPPSPDVFSPLAVFVPHVAYHSAAVRWATAHINVSFNHTYHISYSILSANLSSNNSVMATRIQHATVGDVYSVVLSSLLPNTTYVSSIVSSYGEMKFAGPTISTLPYRELIDIYSFQHPPLPLSAGINRCHGI
jgi:hypothetical protein